MDMMSAMRQAVMVSRARQNERVVAQAPQTGAGDGKKEDQESLAVSWKEALYLATRGGAVALGLPQGVGTFTVGAPFDAQQSRFSSMRYPQLMNHPSRHL